MLLSFKADVFERVVSGEKIYEHRKVFPNEPIEAYLYVSAPVKAIVGVMHLDNRIEIASWKDKYSYDKSTQLRINEYLKHSKYAMEIVDFQNTTSLSLYALRERFPGFVVPQMYYFLDGTDLLDYLKKNLKPLGEKVVHDFSDISSDQICTK